MRVEAATAERNREVRLAATAWHDGGVLGDAGLAAVEAAYPDDRSRLGPVLRTLVGGFVAFGAVVAVGFVSLVLRVSDETAFSLICLACGAGLLLLTEIQTGPLKRAQGGAETATGLLSVLFLTLGLIFLLVELDLSPRVGVIVVLSCAGLLSSLSAVRFGSVTGAVLAAVFFFGLLAQPPNGRLLWIAFGGLSPLLLFRASESARLAPSQRKGLVGSALVCLAALYFALHLGSWDQGILGWLSAWRWSGQWEPDLRAASRLVAVAGTALVPVLVAAAGVWSRRRSVILASIVMAVASLVTLRFYVHVMPISSALILVGTVAILAVLVLRWWLDAAPGRERAGFTGEALFDGGARLQALETAAGMVSFTPSSSPEEVSAGFEGGGGRSGGGGSTESF